MCAGEKAWRDAGSLLLFLGQSQSFWIGHAPFAKSGCAYTTRAYQDFQSAQLEELLTRYGEIGEVWIDISTALPHDYRNTLYARIAEQQPETVILMNHVISDGSKWNVDKVWPTDIIAIERFLPNRCTGHVT